MLLAFRSSVIDYLSGRCSLDPRRELAQIPEHACPRSYFAVCDASDFHHDDIGDDFANFEGAREQCQSLLPDIAREELPDGELHTITCDVWDETGRAVYRGEITHRGTVDSV